MMRTLWAWFKDHWVAISPLLLSLLATVVNGLTKYPRLQGLAHFVMDRLSWTTAKDSPGTFKLPLIQSSQPPTGHHKPWVPKSSTPVVLGLVLVFSLGASGCCLFNGTTCKQGTAGFCVQKDIKDRVDHILPSVAEILMNGSGDVEAELGQLAIALGVDTGVDILRCAVAAFYAQSGTGAPIETRSWRALSPSALANGHYRAGLWLEHHPTARK